MTTDSIRPELDAIAAGTHFWCETHLCALPVANKSPDPRYCQDCFDVLTEEAKMLENRHTKRLPTWVPVSWPVSPVQQGREPVTDSTDAASDVGEDVTAPSTPEPARDNGKTPLDAAISDMAAAGLSTRAISEQLAMHGIAVSHMTIARHLRAGR